MIGPGVGPFLIALLFAVAGDSSGGRLFVHIAPGFEIIIDGRPAGTSTFEGDGLSVATLPAGMHQVLVRSADGREGNFSVSITDGQTTEIEVSALGLRRRLGTAPADDRSQLNINCVPAGCSAEFRGMTETTAEDNLSFESVPPGHYPLVVTHEKTSLHLDAEVPASAVVTVLADFKGGTLRIADTKRRPRRLQLVEPNDALAALSVPAYWKSAIRGVLPSGVTVLHAEPKGANGVMVTMRVPSAEVGRSMARALVNSTVFSSVTAPTAARREGNAVVIDFTFNFPPVH